MGKHLKSFISKRHIAASASRTARKKRPMIAVLTAVAVAGCSQDEPTADYSPLTEPLNSLIDGLQSFGWLLFAFLVAAGISFFKVEWQHDIRLYLTKVLILAAALFFGYVLLLGIVDFFV